MKFFRYPLLHILNMRYIYIVLARQIMLNYCCMYSDQYLRQQLSTCDNCKINICKGITTQPIFFLALYKWKCTKKQTVLSVCFLFHYDMQYAQYVKCRLAGSMHKQTIDIQTNVHTSWINVYQLSCILESVLFCCVNIKVAIWICAHIR